MADYDPKPIDTSKIDLGSDLRELVEQLAANAHDVWGAKRIEDGWRYGPERNDQAKLHPCLVPYVELPESEKTYDRIMVEQAIKSVVALGWRIERPKA